MDDVHVNGVASDCIEFIFESFSNQVDENILATMEVPYATQLAMLKINKIVQLAIVQPDGDNFVDGLLERLDADGEPCPSAIDSWARGAGTLRLFSHDGAYLSL